MFSLYLLCTSIVICTSRKVSRYGVFSAPYFPVFGLNSGKYGPEETLYRSSHRMCSVKKGVLRNFAKFTGKHLCQRLFLKTNTSKNTISKNTFFTEHLRTTASDFIYDTKSQSVKFLSLDKTCFLLFCLVYGFKS